MRGRQPTTGGIAVIRASTGPTAVIRILEVAGGSHDDHVLGITTSPDEAARIIGDWLRMVIGRSSQLTGNDQN